MMGDSVPPQNQVPRIPEEGTARPAMLANLPDDGPTGGFFRDRQLAGRMA